MQTLDRSLTPSGGWKFYQPETQWTMPNPLSQSWGTAVDRIVQHRKANVALASTANVAQAEADLEAYTISRLPRQVVDDGSGRTAKASSGCGGCGKR